jgi:hypothetical protein
MSVSRRNGLYPKSRALKGSRSKLTVSEQKPTCPAKAPAAVGKIDDESNSNSEASSRLLKKAPDKPLRI